MKSFKCLFTLLCLLLAATTSSYAQSSSASLAEVQGPDMLFVDVTQNRGDSVLLSFPIITKEAIADLRLSVLFDTNGESYPFTLERNAEPYLDTGRSVDAWHEYTVYFTVNLPDKETRLTSALVSVNQENVEVKFGHFMLRPIPNAPPESPLYFQTAALNLPRHTTQFISWEMASEENVKISKIAFSNGPIIKDLMINGVLFNSENMAFYTGKNSPFTLSVLCEADSGQKLWTYTYVNLLITYELSDETTFTYALPMVSLYSSTLSQSQLEEYVAMKVQ